MFDLLWWVVPAVLVNLAVTRFIWEPTQEKSGRPVPTLLRYTVAFVIYLLAVFGTVAFVYRLVQEIPAQRIVSTHSPYVCSQSSIESFRHFARHAGGTRVTSLLDGGDPLSPEDVRRINREVINTRIPLKSSVSPPLPAPWHSKPIMQYCVFRTKKLAVTSSAPTLDPQTAGFRSDSSGWTSVSPSMRSRRARRD